MQFECLCFEFSEGDLKYFSTNLNSQMDNSCSSILKKKTNIFKLFKFSSDFIIQVRTETLGAQNGFSWFNSNTKNQSDLCPSR